MKIGNFDIFKLLIVILLGLFIWIYYNNSTVGRYQLSDGFIIDTKTGQSYSLRHDEVREFSPPILK